MHAKRKLELVLILANDLHELLQTPRNIVRIGKLGPELVLDLLRLIKAELPIRPHRLIISVTILVSADQQVNVMAWGPPDGRPLAVENAWRQKTEKVFAGLKLQNVPSVFGFIVGRSIKVLRRR